ncbi:putative bifunctional diguanylate cyclase/phosphodiesterase [Roseibium sp.]|uniref:putative bifunctional diguanylate cyclase/phosphodiesterase n=1 Tax=Roseibium sp. TaxID=1936156 RepID=UPI003A98600D
MLKRVFALGLLVAFGLGMAWLGQLSLNHTVDDVIVVNAERKARNWADYLAESIPDLPALILSGEPNQAQKAAIKTATHVGDVFRFKLFDADARLVLISDELGLPLEVGARADHNGHARLVLDTGKAQIDVNDGTSKANRPDLYVEAYVPVMAADGQALGVVEVYVDQTELASLFRNSFLELATFLGLIFIATFAVPFSAYVTKMRQHLRTGEKVRLLSSFDQLTGLYNRVTFFLTIEQRCKGGELDLAETAVIYIDVDKFKTINDTFGHKIGDEFLRHVGNAISSHLGRGELAARFGGDEFVILSTGRSQSELEEMIDNLRATVSEPVRLDGIAITGHLSLGVYIDDGEDLDLQERLHKADVALYQAKLMGRNTFAIFSPDLESKIARRKHVEESVLLGLAADRFEVHFQPLIDPERQYVAGFEALLRLTDANGEKIPPAEFIPIAEESGEIQGIGKWVLREAIRIAADWPDHLFVSVNLSTRQFEDGKLVETIRSLLLEHGLAPRRLELEVTESLLVEHADTVSDQLIALRELGISLAMDDFGTGYSSLGYLWRFNFNKLKIDRSFIRDISASNSKSRHILDAIIMLGHKLDMQVTAEGIETAEEAEALNSFACDHFQGFFYGHPMPQSELAPYLLKHAMLPMRRDAQSGQGGKTACG